MKPQKIGDYKIPFDKNGNQMTYVGHWHEDVEWRENTPFVDEITYIGFQRGRSAAHLLFQTSKGKEVTMFLQQFDRVVQHMSGGKFAGTFRFIKRGENYSITLVEPAS